MILLIDIGNTNVVVGISDGKKILKTVRLVTQATLTEDEYFSKFQALGLDKYLIDGVAISSVVPQLDNIFVSMIQKYYQVKPLVVAAGIKSGLKIRIDNPKQLGADLLCDCVGAYEKYPSPVVVVDLGTATKIFVVNKNKECIGGIIAPGLVSSLNSLVSSAAKLSNISLAIPPKVIESDTTRCIQSGAIIGHACMIDGMLDKIIKELGNEEVGIVLTGGLAGLIKPLLNHSFYDEPTILLEGLLSIYHKNL